MMAHFPEIDVIYNVVGGDSEDGNTLQVRPSPDNPEGWIELRTPDKVSEEFWGSIRISFSKAFAAKLGQALLKASE